MCMKRFFMTILVLCNLALCSCRYIDTANEESVEGVQLYVNLYDETGTFSVPVYTDVATAQNHVSTLDLFPTGWGHGQRCLKFTISSAQQIVSVEHVGPGLFLVTDGYNYYTATLENQNLITPGTSVSGESWSDASVSTETLKITLEDQSSYYFSYRDN